MKDEKLILEDEATELSPEEISELENEEESVESPVEPIEEPTFDWGQYLADYLEDSGKGNLMVDAESLVDCLDWIYTINANNRMQAFDPETEEYGYVQPINLLVVGDPGGGKSSIIEEWAKNKRIVLRTMTGAELTDDLVKGLPAKDEKETVDPVTGEKKIIKKQEYLPSTAFDLLDSSIDENGFSVLFLDELNRSWPEAEAGILTLVQSHWIADQNYEDGKHRFKKFLFTVAACNPPDSSSETRNLSLALSTRFRLFEWNNNPEEMKKFWNKVYDQRIANLSHPKNPFPKEAREANIKLINGRKDILNALIENGFQFSDKQDNIEAGRNVTTGEGETIVVNARTLASALDACNGMVGKRVNEEPVRYTRHSFLDEFEKNCGKKHLLDAEFALLDLADAQDAANGYQKTILDRLRKYKIKNNLE